jgi:hypothetical protein
VKTCRETFDILLNWDSWGITMRDLIASAVDRKHSTDEVPVISSH